MAEKLNSRPDILPRINEADARETIIEAEKWLESHSDFYKAARCFGHNTEATREMYAEIGQLYKDLNLAAKSLIAQGGEVPAVLCEITRLLEKFGLVLGHRKGGEFFTYYEDLGEGACPKKDKKISSIEWLAMRSVLVHHTIIPKNSISKNRILDFKNFLVEESPPLTISDVLHLNFLGEGNLDLGWVALNLYLEELKTWVRKKAEGVVRRSYREAEIARGNDDPEKNYSKITLISEARKYGPEMCRLPPKFFGEIGFGNFDATKEKVVEYIQKQVEKNYKLLIWQIIMGSRKKFYDKQGVEILRGGRRGDSPAQKTYKPTLENST